MVTTTLQAADIGVGGFALKLKLRCGVGDKQPEGKSWPGLGQCQAGTKGWEAPTPPPPQGLAFPTLLPNKRSSSCRPGRKPLRGRDLRCRCLSHLLLRPNRFVSYGPSALLKPSGNRLHHSHCSHIQALHLTTYFLQVILLLFTWK